jgi:hypothetical protein
MQTVCLYSRLHAQCARPGKAAPDNPALGQRVNAFRHAPEWVFMVTQKQAQRHEKRHWNVTVSRIFGDTMCVTHGTVGM